MFSAEEKEEMVAFLFVPFFEWWTYFLRGQNVLNIV